jgi:hypothetical protein
MSDVTVFRLPLWKNVLEALLQGGVSYGDTFDTAYFEDGLKCQRETMEFGIAMSQIRAGLMEHGLYLTGRGGNGKSFTVCDPAANVAVMQSYQREAVRALQKGVILGTNTDMARLTEDERRRHEAVLERMAIRAALVCRTTKELKRLGVAQ